MIQKIKSNLDNENGSGVFWGLILCSIFLMIFIATSEYLGKNVVLNGVKDGLETIAVELATENYNEIYPNSRQGYFGAYKLGNNDVWQDNIDKSDITNILNKTLGVKLEDGKYVKRNKSNKVEFILSNVKFRIKNPKVAPEDSEKNKEEFIVEVSSDVEVNKLYNFFSTENIKTKIESKVRYMPKY